MTPYANLMYSIGLFLSLATLSSWISRRQKSRVRRAASLRRAIDLTR